MPGTPGAARCYLVAWTAVKLQWGLSVDEAEQDALARSAADCPGIDVDVHPVP